MPPRSIYELRQEFNSPYQFPGQQFGPQYSPFQSQQQNQPMFTPEQGIQAGLAVGDVIGNTPLRGESYSTFGEQSGVGRTLGGLSGAVPVVDPTTAAIKAGLKLGQGYADTIKYLTSDLEDVDLGGITPYYQKPDVDIEGLEQMQEDMPTAFGAGLRTFGKTFNPFLAVAAGSKAKKQKEEFGQDVERARELQSIGEEKYRDFQKQRQRSLATQQNLAMRSNFPSRGASIYNLGYSNYL